RIHLFFNWYWHPRECPAAMQARILPRIEERLRREGLRVRVLHRAEEAGQELEFHPELFGQRARASELLEAAGFTWFSDYSSIDLVQEEYGLEVCGIQKERDARRIQGVLERGFPHWHYVGICPHDSGREPGWTVA